MSLVISDHKMDVLFGQLELLSELALIAGDAELSSSLTALLATTLSRYCDAKRAQLAATYSENLPTAKCA